MQQLVSKPPAALIYGQKRGPHVPVFEWNTENSERAPGIYVFCMGFIGLSLVPEQIPPTRFPELPCCWLTGMPGAAFLGGFRCGEKRYLQGVGNQPSDSL